MAHIEHPVHLFPGSTALFPDHPEQWRRREEIVLDDVEVVRKVQDLGLASARAVDDAVDVRTEFLQHHPDYRSVNARGREHQFAGIQWYARNPIGQTECATVNEIGGHFRAVAFRVFCRI